jgi:hypothetical protein
MDNLEWSLPEYEDKERSRDWYWTLGIIVVCASVTSIIYSNYFFAALLILGGLLLGYFSIRKPEVVYHQLGSKGLRIGRNLYPYKTLKSFSLQIEPKPMLIVHSARAFMPIITVPIEEEMAEIIEEIMLSNNVPEENIKPHSAETIMDSLGF